MAVVSTMGGGLQQITRSDGSANSILNLDFKINIFNSRFMNVLL